MMLWTTNVCFNNILANITVNVAHDTGAATELETIKIKLKTKENVIN